MYPRGGACTVSVASPTYGFAAEKDIPKVVSDGEINPIRIAFLTTLHKKNSPIASVSFITYDFFLHD